MSEVKERGLLVSVALYPDEDLDIQPYAVADRIHIMSYERGPRHSTFEQAVTDLELFAQSGVPLEKLVLGVPFYGRQTAAPFRYLAYSDIIVQYQPGNNTDEIAGFYFNSIVTTQRKTCYALENGFAGVMIWELGQDSRDETSLLRAIY